MPPAARITDRHTCPAHGGGPDVTGEPTVLIGFQPAARVGDTLVCGPTMDAIAFGEPSVLIGNQPAARLGDPTDHGGLIAAGCFNVLIGSTPQADALRTDQPFCEECERRRKEIEERRQKALAEATATRQPEVDGPLGTAEHDPETEAEASGRLLDVDPEERG